MHTCQLEVCQGTRSANRFWSEYDMYCPQLSAKKFSVFWKCVSYVPEEDRGTREGGKSQLKAVMLLIFTHSFSLDIYLPLVGVDLRLETRRGEIAGQHADT